MVALHEASFRGHVDVVLALLEFGADSHVEDTLGWTALASARDQGHSQVSLLLEEAPARGVRLGGFAVGAVVNGGGKNRCGGTRK